MSSQIGAGGGSTSSSGWGFGASVSGKESVPLGFILVVVMDGGLLEEEGEGEPLRDAARSEARSMRVLCVGGSRDGCEKGMLLFGLSLVCARRSRLLDMVGVQNGARESKDRGGELNV